MPVICPYIKLDITNIILDTLLRKDVKTAIAVSIKNVGQNFLPLKMVCYTNCTDSEAMRSRLKSQFSNFLLVSFNVYSLQSQFSHLQCDHHYLVYLLTSHSWYKKPEMNVCSHTL